MLSQTQIGKLTVTSGDQDRLALRIKLTRALSASPLRPLMLPATAILCIRRLGDPLPGAIRMQYSGAHVPADWHNAVQMSLSELAAHAARPVRDPVTSGTEAVLFADRAELLACLAADQCEGMVAHRWWWNSLFPDASSVQPLLTPWLEAPEYVPAALHHLAVLEMAVPFIQGLTTGDARTLLQRVTYTFGLRELQVAVDVALDRGLPNSGNEPSLLEDSNDGSTSDLRRMPDATRRPNPASGEDHSTPWQNDAPEATVSGLLPEQQCLLGIGLVLRRAPSTVRTDTFIQAVRQWQPARTIGDVTEMIRAPIVDERNRFTEATHTDDRRTDNTEDLPLELPPPAPASDVRQNPRDMANLAAPSLPESSDTTITPAGISRSPRLQWQQQAAVPTPRVQQQGEEAADPNAPRPTSTRLPFSPATPSLEPVDAPAFPAGLPIRSPDETESNPAPVLQDAPVGPSLDPLQCFDAQITTQLGGLFYLINLGLFLGLYADFTSPAQPGIALPLWDFVTLLGRRLLGDTQKDDPVWDFLARLACRTSGDEPGRDFRPPDLWRVPAEWLYPFPDSGVWRWEAAGTRLRVRHPAGFLVLDVPAEGKAREGQLLRETRPYREAAGFELQEAPVSWHDGTSTLERWLDWLTPYIRARLQRALAPETGDDPVSLLFRSHARVTSTATHLDVIMPLLRLPIAVRLAGLDRDPGWVPAAGRYIRFHFE